MITKIDAFINFCKLLKKAVKEDFLYYIWQYKLFSNKVLHTIDKKPLLVKKSGIRNTNSGTDFLNAHLEIDNQLWVGNVEMHVKSSDWYLHNHEKDKNYDAVILHVVWQHDAVVFMKNDKPLPTLVLEDFVSKEIKNNYRLLLQMNTNFIACERQISEVDDFVIKNWLERLYFERLETKSTFIKELLAANNNDFEATLFQLLANNFGLKINGDAFLSLSKSIDFALVRKTSSNENIITALLFGQAGFLEENIEDKYFKELKQEYEYLRHKYHLKPISKNEFQFFRMRPHNFPTIRIAQLAALFHQHQNLFSKILNINKKEDFYALFKVALNDFWKTHYTFTSTSKRSNKQLTKSFIDLLIINTITPLKFVYLQNRGEVNEGEIVNLIQQVSSEKNSIINHFLELGVKSKNAMESQALLTLKNNYCTKKQCLQCAIGNALLRTKN